ncbi:TPA: O-antigen translocase [Vibrio fluvialis]|nr:O-antigen translocase [Vibrio fluvialis]
MKRLLSVTAFTAILTLIKMVCGFIVSKVVAIYAGPSGVAMLGQLQSMVTSLNGIANSAVNTPVVRYTAENKELNLCSPWWRASLTWAVILLSILSLLGVVFASEISILLFSDDKYYWLVLTCICSLPLTAIGTLFNSIVNGFEQYRKFIYRGMLSVIVSTSLIVLMIINYGLPGALLTISIQTGIIGFIIFFLSLREPWFKVKIWFGSVKKEKMKGVGGYIIMAVVSAMVVQVSLIVIRNDIITHVGWEEAGNWQAVRKISDVYLGVITTALSAYFLPKLSSLKNADSIISEVNRTALVIVPISASLALFIYFFRDFAISLLFTSEFNSARDLFAFQLIGDVVKMTSWLYAYPMLSRGATKWFVGSEVAFSATFVILSSIAIDLAGVEGVNMAYFINYLLYFTFVFFNVKKFCR